LGTSDLCGCSLESVLPELVPSARAGREGPERDLEIEGRVLSPYLSEAILDSDRICLVALRDVTEERRAIRRRIDFYSMIAHDLRSPLHAIRLRCELAQQGVLQSPQQIEESFRKIAEHTTALVELIDHFLELGRMEDEKRIGRERVDLALLLRETVELLEPLARQKQISLSVRAPERAEVLGDRARLSQVIANILGNALKFTPPEGHVDAEVHFAEGDTVEISVTDDGPGIAEKDVPHIFERYHRADSSDRAVGSGLGLAIVRQLVDAHDGTVGVTSKIGEGSRFWVRLPGTSHEAH
jgi:two-component system phosphate regulon sensor histidine kinase PhoR